MHLKSCNNTICGCWIEIVVYYNEEFILHSLWAGYACGPYKVNSNHEIKL